MQPFAPLLFTPVPRTRSMRTPPGPFTFCVRPRHQHLDTPDTLPVPPPRLLPANHPHPPFQVTKAVSALTPPRDNMNACTRCILFIPLQHLNSPASAICVPIRGIPHPFEMVFNSPFLLSEGLPSGPSHTPEAPLEVAPGPSHCPLATLCPFVPLLLCCHTLPLHVKFLRPQVLMCLSQTLLPRHLLPHCRKLPRHRLRLPHERFRFPLLGPLPRHCNRSQLPFRPCPFN
mmetsp:Transcript_28970/g.67733  ORF Transcript_28970/g.67733 Transcript_28970/m.67733 type:complete len:230 (+) Transcript_28970:84-773(+)